MYDPNSLMYVTKEYENSLKDKVKKIVTDDTVRETLDSVNSELDNILLEINNRLNEITNKSDEIDTYRADIHRFIDQTSINTKDLVDSNTSSTVTHPSVLANKQDRSESRLYNYTNFINQKIELSSFDDVKIGKNTIKSDDYVRSFDIKLSDKELLKVVEFAITYKQAPEIIRQIVDSEITYKEKSVIVNRVFTGRFYIIRPDIDNNPQNIIVKAVVENADNTSDNKDVRVIDVRSSKESEEIKYDDNIGPEFDMYFNIRSSDTLTISIGNIVPYKWLIQKDEKNTNKSDDPKYVNFIIGNIKNKFNKILFSTNLNTYFLLTDTECYYTTDNHFNESSFKKLENVDINVNNFLIKDIGSLTFIHSGVKTYVCSNVENIILTKHENISDIKQLSTSEIVALIPNKGLFSYNSANNDFNDSAFIRPDGTKLDNTDPLETVSNGIDILEIDNNKLLVATTTSSGNINYFVVPINLNTNSYGDSAIVSTVVSNPIENFSLTNADTTKVKLINTVVGIALLVDVSGNLRELSTIYNLKNLVINDKSYEFKNFVELKLYDTYSDEEKANTEVILRDICDTTLASFAISKDHQLYVFDDKYIIKAITTREITDESGETPVKLGYDDDKSYIKLDNSERYEGDYFNKENPYLNNVLGIYENPTGIYIVDSNGLYEFTTNLTLKTRYYNETNPFVSYINDRVVNKRTIFINNIDTSTGFYESSDIIKENTDLKLKYNYINLYTGNYNKYDTNNIPKSYDYDVNGGKDCPLVIFKASLYVSLIDVTGSLYNTYSSAEDTIRYSNKKYTFNVINPDVKHVLDFIVDEVQEDGSIKKKTIQKEVETKEFILRTNKYGFLNYFGFNTENLNSDNVSDINDKKVYKIVHTKEDTDVSFDDIRNTIVKLIYKNGETVKTAIGKTELKYTDLPGVFDKYRIRTAPVIVPTGREKTQVTWLDFVWGRLWYIADGKVYKTLKGNNETNPFNTDDEVYTNTTTQFTAKGFKETSVGVFIWGTEGIDLCETSVNYTWANKLTSYNKETDGNIIDVVDCKDSRQTVLILCDKCTYAINCRPTAGSTFRKPFSLPANIHKLEYSALAETDYINRAYILDGEIYLASNNASLVLKMTYGDTDNIVISTVLAKTTINNLVGNDDGIIQVRKLGDELLILDKNFNIIKYNVKTSISSVLYKSDIVGGANLCDTETEKYFYYCSNKTGLWRLTKSDLTFENIDPTFFGILYKFDGVDAIYAISNIDGTEVNKVPVITIFNPDNSTYEPIADVKNHYNSNIEVGLIRQRKMICGSRLGVFYATNNKSGNPIKKIFNQVIDSKQAYTVRFFGAPFGGYVKAINRLNDDQYYIGGNAIAWQNSHGFISGNLKLYKNISVLSDQISYSLPTYNATTDTTKDSNKTYYEFDNDNFTEAYHISTFDPNVTYYIASDTVEYEKVDTSVITKPERNKEYFIKNLEGKYVSCGYSFTEFSTNLSYYVQKNSYSVFNTSGKTPDPNTKYYVNPEPYKVLSGDFVPGKTYYEKTTTVVNYNYLVNNWISKKGFMIYVLCTEKKPSDTCKYLTVVFNLDTKQRTLLPFRIDRLWDTSVGTFVRYIKNSKTATDINIGCLSEDFRKIVYDIDDANISDVKTGDILEINNEDNLKSTLDDSKDIFICGKFGVNGKVLRYSPKTTDTFNKFHPVATNSLGFIRLFNIDDSVYSIENDSTLIIYKYNPDTGIFAKNYTGREFVFSDLAYKIDNDNKKDVYIFGSGDYNIYKSYNNTFKPVMTWYNKTIGKPISVISTDDRIYLKCNDYTTRYEEYKCINNNSDDKFEFSWGYDNDEHANFPTQSTYYLTEDGHKYIPINSLLTFNLDNEYIGRTGYFGSFSENNNADGYWTDESSDNISDVNSFHNLDHRINLNPIESYDHTQLIYTCFDTDPNTLLPTGEIQHLYDSDGVTIKHYNPVFDMYIDSEYGTFAIQGDEVYLKKRYTENNSRWKLINTLKTTNSSFKVIKYLTKLGWILCDDTSVTKFNPESGKFDIELKVGTWTNTGAKINYIEELGEEKDVFIASITPGLDVFSGTRKPMGVKVWSCTNSSNGYAFNEIDLNYDSTYALMGLFPTSKGIFMTLVKYPNTYAKINKNNYGNWDSEVRIFNFDKRYNVNGSNYDSWYIVTAEYLTSPESGYTWTGVTNSLHPLDMRQVLETKLGIIVLKRTTVCRDSGAANNNTNTSVISWIYKNNKFYPCNINTPNSVIEGYNISGGDFGSDTYNYSYESKTIVLDDNSVVNIRDKDTNNYSTENKNPFLFTYDGYLSKDSVPSMNIEIIKGTKTDEENLLVRTNNFSNCRVKFKKSNGTYYLLVLDINHFNTNVATTNPYICLYKIRPATHSFELVPNSIISSEVHNISASNYDSFVTNKLADETWDILDFNGQIFVKVFDKVFIKGNKKLTEVTNDNTSSSVKTDVLYSLKATFENDDIYNNLRKVETANSEIDKLVVKETGVLTFNSDSYTDRTGNIDQYINPNNYYDLISNNYSTYSNDDNSTIKQTILNLYKPNSSHNLVSNRFLNKSKDVLATSLSHHTSDVLKDLDKYLKPEVISNTGVFKIDLMIYPSSVIDKSLSNTVLVDTL